MSTDNETASTSYIADGWIKAETIADGEGDLVSSVFQPRIEALLDRYELGITGEKDTVRWMREEIRHGNADDLIKALIRICSYRAKKISYLAFTY